MLGTFLDVFDQYVYYKGRRLYLINIKAFNDDLEGKENGFNCLKGSLVFSEAKTFYTCNGLEASDG